MQKKLSGHINVFYVATTGGANAFVDCTGIFTLAGGTLVGVAAVRPNSHGPTRVAITGGTGSYGGARGSILSVPTSRTRASPTTRSTCCRRGSGSGCAGAQDVGPPGTTPGCSMTAAAAAESAVDFGAVEISD
jgi:hypothetical protein